MLGTANKGHSTNKDGPFRSTLRFRAANGAMIDVSVDLPVAADETGLALQIAREAITQVAAALSDSRQPHPSGLTPTFGTLGHGRR